MSGSSDVSLLFFVQPGLMFTILIIEPRLMDKEGRRDYAMDGFSFHNEPSMGFLFHVFTLRGHYIREEN